MSDDWYELKAGITSIFQKESLTTNQYMNLYTLCYNLSLQSTRKSDFYAQLAAFLTARAKEMQSSAADLNGEDILNFYSKQWEDFKFSVKILNGIAAYFNNQWIKSEFNKGRTEVRGMSQLAFLVWRDHLVNEILTNAVLRLIENERDGLKINAHFVSSVITSFVELGIDMDNSNGTGHNLEVYREIFEKPFLTTTEDYYSRESVDFLEDNQFPEYLRRVEQRLSEEQKRVRTYMHDTTAVKLAKRLEFVFIEKRFEQFQAEFRNLLVQEKHEDLALLYLLVARLPHFLTELRTIFEQHVHSQGLMAVATHKDTAPNDPISYIQTILNTHKKFNALILTAFRNDPGFVSALDKACGKFVNTNAVTSATGADSVSCSSPELLAKYCDSLLKKSIKNSEEGELEDHLNQVMGIFKYLTDKDVFLSFYSKKLAKRLINGLSTSDDAEASMISKLKLNCGFEYTNKLQKMFEDMTISKTLNEQYRQAVPKQPGEIDFTIAALRSNSWPFSQGYAFHLPVELETSVNSFKKFYAELHSGRRISILNHLSRGEVVANCFKNRYCLQASTIQIAILLQFNETVTMTLKQLCENIGATEAQIVPVLQILLKVKLLNCALLEAVAGQTPATFDSMAVLELNTAFRNKKMRININMPLKAEQRSEELIAHKHIEDDRKIMIQALIVQILKMRKRMNHTELIAELLQRLAGRFKPKIQTIKKCIGMLIEKEYLERLEGQTEVYCYLA